MVTPSRELELTTEKTKDEEQISNGWEKLLLLLNPAVINAPGNPAIWQRLPSEMVTWLTNTASKGPWLNHLALAGVIYAENSQAAHPARGIQSLYQFLNWAIPDHYPDLASLEPEAAIVAYYGDPPQYRGRRAATAYGSLQLYMQRYLSSVSEEKRVSLTPFLLPDFVSSRQLTKLRQIVETRAKQVRKKQTFAVIRNLPDLIALGRRRYKWLADLETRYQQVTELVKQRQATLPAVIILNGLDTQQTITFRIWDRASWIGAHRTSYGQTTYYRTQKDALKPPRIFFLQLIGELPASPWFLRAIALGAIQGAVRPLPEARKYLEAWNIPYITGINHVGILNPGHATSQILSRARRVAQGTPEDSRVIFCIEPLFAASVVGLFTLISIASTGMRLGELMQVTLDRDCMESGSFPQFDDKTGQWVEGPKQLYWRLYPKGSIQRERYLVTAHMLETLLILLDLHKRYYGQGSFKPCSPDRNFSHRRRFFKKHKFVLQWAGRHISQYYIEKCLDFLLLEHPCRCQDGKPPRITPHVLRHAVAGWLRSQGVPLEDIMSLLKQVNIAVTDYYSKLSPQDLYQKIGPALTTLTDMTGIDPAAIRTEGDIQNLANEALKCYGVLRRTPGGTCSIFTSCEVQFKCASCPAYIPDPARRDEVHEKIATHTKAIQLFEQSDDYLQADVQKAYLRDWKRVEREMDALVQVELVSPSAECVLGKLGIDDLGQELLQNLNQFPQLSSGDNETYV